MLTILPAVVLILIRLLSTLAKRRQALAYGALIASCTAYSVLLLRADADFADYGRRAAAELIAPRVAAGEKVWYGGQWGFYWYAREPAPESPSRVSPDRTRESCLQSV